MGQLMLRNLCRSDCLSQGFFGAFGLNGLELINANFWYPEGFPKHLNQQPNKHHIDPFQSARELAQKAAKYGLGAERTLPLGSEIDIWNMSICDIDLIHGDAMGKEMKRTNYRKPHALPGTNSLTSTWIYSLADCLTLSF